MSEPRPAGHLAQACIHVRDLDRALALYRDLLGMPVIRHVRREPPARSGACLGTNDLHLEVWERLEAPADEAHPETATGLKHIAVWVRDLDGLRERLAAAGYPFMRDVFVAANWMGDHIRVGMFQDRDGVTVELLDYQGPATTP